LKKFSHSGGVAA